MELVFLLLTIVGIIIALIFGYLQVVVPFIKGEVRLSRRFPFVETAEVSAKRPRRRRKKKRKRFLIPILAIGILIIIAVLVRFLVFQAQAREQVPIAVISFTNRTGDAQFDYLCEAIPNLLITNLEQSEYLSVLTWERMRDLLKVLGREDVKLVDEDLGFELCEMDNIHAVVTGSFTKAGTMFVTEVKVLNVADKRILKTSSSQGEGVASILKIQIDELSEDIARSVSLYERVAAPTEMQIMEVTTSSMEAYNYFLRGREDAEKLYFEDAKRFLEKAIEIDSTFAAAYFSLSHVYAWLLDNKASANARAKALAFADKTTEKERLYITGYFEEDPEKGFRVFEKLATKYPKEKWAHFYLGTGYSQKEQYHKAIEEYNKALELDPNWGIALNVLAFAYAEIGDYAQAIECFERYAAASPGDANPFDSMGDLYFRMGQLDDALVQYKEALFVKQDFSLSPGKIAYIYALREDYTEAMKWVDYLITNAPSSGTQASGYLYKAFYNYLLGNFDQTLHILDTVENMAEPIEWQRGIVTVDLMKALNYYEQGEFEQSRNYFNDSYGNLDYSNDTLRSNFYKVDHNFYLGLIDLKQETIDSVRARLAIINSLLPSVHSAYKEHAQFLYDFLYAEVLLAQDSLEKSIAVFENVSTFDVEYAPGLWFTGLHIPYDKDVVARAYYKKGDIDRAVTEYLRLLDPDPNKRGRTLIRPAWHYRLAKLYAEKGIKPKAIAEYEKFLDIWKNADADRPELIDAKKRLAKLKAAS